MIILNLKQISYVNDAIPIFAEPGAVRFSNRETK